MAGKVSVNQIQLGDSGTAANNFVWQTNVDGTCKLARGNAGATTQDILTVDVDGKVSIPMSGKQFPKAWCCFDGTLAGTNPPKAGFNVTSITRNATGDYTINFTNALTNTSYIVNINLSGGVNTSSIWCGVKSATQYGGPVLKSTTQLQVIAGTDYTNSARDGKEIYVTVFGD